MYWLVQSTLYSVLYIYTVSAGEGGLPTASNLAILLLVMSKDAISEESMGNRRAKKKKRKEKKRKDSHDEICAAVQLDKRMRASSSLAIAVNITVNEWSNLHRETPVQQAPVKC